MHIPKERLLSRSGTCMQSCCMGAAGEGACGFTMASRRARRSAAETWQLIPAAKCRPKSGCKDAFDLPLFFCLALRRSQYLRHQCSAGFPPSARSDCPHRARRNRKAAQPSTDAQSLRAPLAVVGAALFGREITGRFRISPSCALTGIRSLIVLLL